MLHCQVAADPDSENALRHPQCGLQSVLFARLQVLDQNGRTSLGYLGHHAMLGQVESRQSESNPRGHSIEGDPGEGTYEERL